MDGGGRDNDEERGWNFGSLEDTSNFQRMDGRRWWKVGQLMDLLALVPCAACTNSVGPILAPCREESDCYATKLKRTQCSCRAVFHKSMGEEGARVRREKEDELDLQVRAHKAKLRSELN